MLPFIQNDGSFQVQVYLISKIINLNLLSLKMQLMTFNTKNKPDTNEFFSGDRMEDFQALEADDLGSNLGSRLYSPLKE